MSLASPHFLILHLHVHSHVRLSRRLIECMVKGLRKLEQAYPRSNRDTAKLTVTLVTGAYPGLFKSLPLDGSGTHASLP